MKVIKMIATALFLIIAVSCNDSVNTLFVHQIQTNDELIGGPTAKGSPGDFILQNDKVRFIVCGAKHSWSYNVFGGGLIDADLVYPYSQFRYKQGTDGLAETFPTVNLTAANPGKTDFVIVNNGTTGDTAQLDVTGKGDIMFETMSLLTGTSGFGPITLKSLFPYMKGNFTYKISYILKKGENYLLVKTTINLPLESNDSKQCKSFFCKANCPNAKYCNVDDCSKASNVEACKKEKQKCEVFTCDKQCDQGFGRDDKTGCPVCVCNKSQSIDYFTESKPIFINMLGEGGSLPGFSNPVYKSGMIFGDYLFFGGQVNLFTPGIGFDETKTIFTNIYSGIDSLTSPMTFDFITGTTGDISYGYFAKNPAKPEKCSYEVALEGVSKAQFDDLKDFLIKKQKFPQIRIEMGMTNLKNTNTPVTLSERHTKQEADNIAKQLKKDAKAENIDSADFVVRVGNECRDAKILIPLFTSSATVGMVGFKNCLYDTSDDDTCDYMRTFTFERYYTVGHGDVASALEPYFKLKGIDTGTFTGRVVNGETGEPLSKVKVFLFHDPFTDPFVSNEDVTKFDYNELTMKNRKQIGTIGAVIEYETDTGFDPVKNGVFSGKAPTGTYIAFARSEQFGISQLHRIKIEKNKTTELSFGLNNAARIDVIALDDKLNAIPVKVVAVALDEQGNPLPHDGIKKIALGDSRYEDGIKKIWETYTGTGSFKLQSGYYRFYVSHGFEYSIDIKDKIRLKPGQVYKLNAQLNHEVDTKGWISGDFHLHSAPSFDSGFPIEKRVVQCLVEGLEFISSSDHDVITDYTPYINELNINQFIKSQIGIELTTVEIGHFLGFPLRFDYTNEPAHNAPDWVCKPLEQIFRELKNLGQFSPKETVVCVPHPRTGFDGYFDQLGLSTYDLTWKPGILEANNPTLRSASCNFDAIELINGKRLERVRTPSVWEIISYNRCFTDIHSQDNCENVGKACSFLQKPQKCVDNPDLHECKWHKTFADAMEIASKETNQVACMEIARDALNRLMIKYLLWRTPEEEYQMHHFVPGSKSNCDPATAPDPWDMEPDLANQPCDKYSGPIDDWFQFFNYNLNVTGMGNSDSHEVFYESGFPRNFIKSSTDRPMMISQREIDGNILKHKVVMSTGPFITFHIEDADIGDTIDLSDPKYDKIPLYIKVQTPSWFGIDRIEIYGNGDLVKEIWVNSKPSEIVDFEQTVEINRPKRDTWYSVVAMGLDDDNYMAPVYTSSPLGQLLLPTVINMAMSSIPMVQTFLGSTVNVPDYFPVLPYSVANPIWVIVDNDGEFTPMHERAPFCPQKCALQKDDQGMITMSQSDCPEDFVCQDDGNGDDVGICGRDVPGECAGKLNDSDNLASQQMPLQSGKLKKEIFKKFMYAPLPKNIKPSDFSRLFVKKLFHYFSSHHGR